MHHSAPPQGGRESGSSSSCSLNPMTGIGASPVLKRSALNYRRCPQATHSTRSRKSVLTRGSSALDIARGKPPMRARTGSRAIRSSADPQAGHACSPSWDSFSWTSTMKDLRHRDMFPSS
jgi:hypothetical protein